MRETEKLVTSSLMDTVQEHLDPTSVSNALYEVMLDWREYSMRIKQARNRGERNDFASKRNVLEKVLSRFVNLPQHEVRNLLSEHFGIVP